MASPPLHKYNFLSVVFEEELEFSFVKRLLSRINLDKKVNKCSFLSCSHHPLLSSSRKSWNKTMSDDGQETWVCRGTNTLYG